MRIRIWVLLVCCAVVAAGQQARKTILQPARYAARGTRGATAGGTGFATEAGMRLYHQKGNAVDAGVAAMYAAAVAEYSHFGFGGEAPLLIRTADGKVYSIAGVGTMPKLATAEFFRRRQLEPGEVRRMEPGGAKKFIPVAGLLPALVPGMVDAGLLALREFGTKSVAEVMAPAIELADGMPMDETRARSIARGRKFFSLWPTSMRTFLPGGRIPYPGDNFRQPDLARTMRSMVAAERKALAAGKSRQDAIDAVRDHFYRGEIARRIDAFSRANDGLLRYDDFASFRLEVEEPLTVDYRGHTVYKSGFWSQGPVLLQILNILEGYNLRAMQSNSAEYIHTVVEAMKLAYADRDTYYADPEYAPVPADRLLSKDYAAERRRQISPRASFAFRPGDVGSNVPHPSEVKMVHLKIDDELMARDTTCVNSVDRNGVMFSATPSGAWMPSVIAGDTGIPLTQRAQSFLLVPGHPNELEGGKRPRITLSPTLVTREGKPFAALSTPGGDNQDQALLQLLLNVVEFGMGTQLAVEAPRAQTRHLVSSFDNHAMNPGELRLDERIHPDVVDELLRRGHELKVRSRWSSGSAPVMIRMLPNGVIEAAADPYGHREAQAW
ncbi:MAG: gamma-glutamyltranspeptidase [bacterium]|nr:gamma-glutamyltranspeptidase [bacterium]